MRLKPWAEFSSPFGHGASGPAVWTFIEGHVEEFSPRWPYGLSVARSGLKSVAQGLPWVVLPTRISPEGAMRYGDNRLGTFEPDRVRVSMFLAPSASGRNVYFRLTQGKPWAKLCWPLRATDWKRPNSRALRA
jgi:hypothetical protein